MPENEPSAEVISSKELLARIQTLTPRETEVLGYILKGLSNDQIAIAIFRSPKTVDKHCQRIYRKLDVHRRVNLVRLCLEAGYTANKPEHMIAAPKSGLYRTVSDAETYAIVEQVMCKGRAWDRLIEIEKALVGVPAPQFLDKFVCALSRILGVKHAGITQSASGDASGTVIAYSIDGKLVPEVFEYFLEATPCSNTIQDGRYHIIEGAQSLFPSDQFLADTKTDSYAGVRLDDRNHGFLGIVWICDTDPMPNESMYLETLSLVAPIIASELTARIYSAQ